MHSTHVLDPAAYQVAALARCGPYLPAQQALRAHQCSSICQLALTTKLGDTGLGTQHPAAL